MLHYDPYMPEIQENPNEIYRQLRAESPLYYVERFDAWAIARFEDIWQASQDVVHYTNTFSTADRSLLDRVPAEMEVISSMDPPRHTEIRKQLFPLFGPAATRRLEPEIRKWTVELLEAHLESGRIDAVRELAQQVAVRVACTLSGFPMEDADYLVDLVTRFFAREEGVEGVGEIGLAARQEAWTYLERVTRERKESAQQRGDSMDIFLSLRGEQGPIELERAARHLTLLLIGATETFPKVFATGLLRLWQHPEQRRELAENPGLIPTALTEILRYDMPTQWLGRVTTADHEIRGQKIRKGQVVMFLYPSGNRDELEFDAPDTFDIHRNAPRILSFGHGQHRCLGAFMARMEGQVLLEELLKRAPDYEVIEDEAIRLKTEFVQGFSHFPIAFGPLRQA